ncbi:MAG: BspA family leucine-rich repeat surface protein [Bacteroidales bacterium]|nr:BspA family leucine-rich repeat surface protein [Bacteroidales bacterium]
MKRLSIGAALIAATLLFLTGCHEKYPNPAYVVGVIEGDFTRTSFKPESDKLKGTWDGGDVISLASTHNEIAEDSDHPEFGLYMASDTGREVSFIMMDESMKINPPYIAFYPSDLMSYELPAIQKYNANGPHQVPMMAKSPTLYLEFKPVCGLMEIKLSTDMEGVNVASLKINADHPISGGFYVDDDYNAIVAGGEGVKLDCGNGVALGSEPKTFWVSVPPGVYSDVRILLTATDGRTQLFTLQKGATVEILRGRVTSCPIELGTFIPTESDTAYLPTGQEFNIAMKALAHPDVPANMFDSAVTDSTILRIDFVTGDKNASGKPLGASEVPVYASFDASTGVMTVSTAAEHLRVSSDCCCMFRYLAALESVDLSPLESEGLADMAYMFNHCHNLKSINLEGWDASQVRTLDNCFSYCHMLEGLDLSGFDTRSVRNMRSLFNHCGSIRELDLRSFKTEQCTIMTYMFYYCSSPEELDISTFDLSNVPGANLNYHFFVTPALKTIRTGAAYIPSDKAAPSSYCTNSTTSMSYRMGSINNGVTFITTQAVADWLAITNLRWIKSGYSGRNPIPVHFIDNVTGNELSVTWAAN